MAEFTTPEDFEKYMALMEEQYKNGFITAKEYNDAQKDAAAGIRGYTANLKNSMSQLGTSFKQMGKAIYDGKQGAATYNETLSSGANAVAAYALKFGPAGIALGAFTKAVTAFVTASLKQSDQLYESYQKISRSGTIGAGAMTEVFDNMIKFGYTVDQLGNLGELLAKNSKNFGTFYQSALKGSRAFANVADDIQNSPLRRQFFNLGMSVDDINDGIAGYINQQGKLGQIQGKTTRDLTQGAEAYIKELDVLTKLTGMNRQEQEDAREQALQIEAFYAGLADLGEKEQEQALAAFTMAYAKGGPKMAAEMASAFNGVIGDSTDLLLTTGGASLKAFSKDFFAKGGTAAESMQLLKNSITPGMAEMTKNLNQVNAGFGLNYRTINNLTKDGAIPLEKIMADLTDEQFKQLTGMDKATAAQGKMRDGQIKTSQNLSEFVKLGVAPATQALAFFTEALNNLTSFIPGVGRTKNRGTPDSPAAPGVSPTGEVDLSGPAAGSGSMAANEIMPALRIKSPEATAGGATSDQLAQIAYEIQSKLGGDLKHFSAFNDSYHQGTDSKHAAGKALDFTITDPKRAAEIASMIQGMPGIAKVIDEYNNPSSRSTAGHIHVEASAANGGVLSGPTGGYQAMLHGTEAVVPLPDGRSIPIETSNQDNGILTAQLDKLDELVSVMKSQVAISQKIMQYSS